MNATIYYTRPRIRKGCLTMAEFGIIFYTAIIHKDGDSGYGVSFPDVPGCFSAGETLDEALHMGAEALALHLEDVDQPSFERPYETVAREIIASSDYSSATDIILPIPYVFEFKEEE